MRNYKFRYFDNQDGTMNDFHGMPMLIEELESVGDRNGMIVMQYTGLTDRNGVEIYEGDILKGLSKETPNGLWTVLDKVYYTNRGTWDCDSFLLGDVNGTCEVIGNIYRNPEILEVTE